MRKTIVKGLQDDLRLDLGCDVGLICAVMDIGKAVDAITFEVEMTGEELIAFIRKHRLSETFTSEINKQNLYLIKAYDW